MQDAKFSGLGHSWWYSSNITRVCVSLCVWVCVTLTAGLNVEGSASGCINAAAADKSFISFILRYKPRRLCRTPATAIYPHQHKDTTTTATLTASLLFPGSLPLSSLPKPWPPPLPTCLPSLVWSPKAICEPHSCESTLHARCTNRKKGKSKHWYMEWGVEKKTFCISYYFVSCLYWANINSSGPFMHFNSVALSRRSTYFICNPLYLEPEILACQGKWQEREGVKKGKRRQARGREEGCGGDTWSQWEFPRTSENFFAAQKNRVNLVCYCRWWPPQGLCGHMCA